MESTGLEYAMGCNLWGCGKRVGVHVWYSFLSTKSLDSSSQQPPKMAESASKVVVFDKASLDSERDPDSYRSWSDRCKSSVGYVRSRGGL